MNRALKVCVALLLTTLCYGCGHTKVSKVGLLSVGDLEGKIIPSTVDGPVLIGKDGSSWVLIPCSYYLSEAVRNALEGTAYDTLVDVEVKTQTGPWIYLFWLNQIQVTGKGLDSRILPKAGGAK